MMNPMKFGAPPDDAIADPDAVESLLGPRGYQPQPNNPFLEDVPDIMKVGDDNPFKTPTGESKVGMMSGGMPAMGDTESPIEDASEPPGFEDEEAVRQAILDSAARDNLASRAYQEKVLKQNDEESLEKRKIEAGEM